MQNKCRFACQQYFTLQIFCKSFSHCDDSKVMMLRQQFDQFTYYSFVLSYLFCKKSFVKSNTWFNSANRILVKNSVLLWIPLLQVQSSTHSDAYMCNLNCLQIIGFFLHLWSFVMIWGHILKWYAWLAFCDMYSNNDI